MDYMDGIGYWAMSKSYKIKEIELSFQKMQINNIC